MLGEARSRVCLLRVGSIFLGTGHLGLRRLCGADGQDFVGTRLETTGVVSNRSATAEAAVGWRWPHMPRPHHTERGGFGPPGEKATGARGFNFPPQPLLR